MGPRENSLEVTSIGKRMELEENRKDLENQSRRISLNEISYSNEERKNEPEKKEMAQKIRSLLNEQHFSVLICGTQLFFFILLAIFARYEKKVDPTKVFVDYPSYQDTHVMIFIGFGFLMTFLKKYGFSALSINLLLSVVAIEWSLIMRGFFKMRAGTFNIGITELLYADFSAAVVLISMGVLLGKLTPFQYVLMTLIEIPVSVFIEWIVVEQLKINDAGGSIVLHTFGAYFGLACSMMIQKSTQRGHRNEESVYHSDQFAMIGSIFLWICWPSFNSATADSTSRERAIVNTVISLIGSTIATFVVSQILDHKKKFDMVTIANSSLAGGVAVGTVANVIVVPVVALFIGLLAGTVSVFGYKFLTPFLSNRFGLHDTCGVHNLHGMPGIIAGIASIFVFITPKDEYGDGLGKIYPGIESSDNKEGYHYWVQAPLQLAALVIVLIASTASGLVTGLLLRLPVFKQLEEDDHFTDSTFFETPKDFEKDD